MAKEYHTRSKASVHLSLGVLTCSNFPEPQPKVWIDQTPAPIDTSDSLFLSLPAEIRNRIYKFYAWAENDKPQLLSHFKLPPIVFVCRQTRDEMLPIFFAEGSFIVVTGANYEQVLRGYFANRFPGNATQETTKRARNLAQAAMAGTMNMRRATKKLIDAMQERALFKHIFVVVSSIGGLDKLRASMIKDQTFEPGWQGSVLNEKEGDPRNIVEVFL